jgi:uncharacterized membrane protein
VNRQRFDRRAVRSAFLRSRQGPVFLTGCWMLLLWIAAVACLWQWGNPQWDDILTVGFAHLLAGRAISIAQGTQVGLPRWLIVLVATYADTMGMLIVFPLFVYSYEHFVEGRFFQKRMRSMLESAQRNVDRFGRYKVAGVFFFVWLPFWMTGIIVGAILGYLLGLRTWVTIVTVILGAFAAVASWVYAYDKLFLWLSRIHQEIPFLFTLALLVGLLLFRILRKRRAQHQQRTQSSTKEEAPRS